MVTTNQLAASKAIQRRTGVTFHIATRFLPKRVRRATYVLYAFFRVADDVVDDPDPAPPPVQHAELDRIRDAALGEREADDPVLAAFDEIRKRHGIAPEEIDEFVEAMKADIPARTDGTDEGAVRKAADFDGFEDANEMNAYLRGSAVAVAYMMLAVMDPDDPEAARPHARALGEAFQLTNFLRDVREDVVEYDRIYLPRTTLDRHGATETDIENLRCTRAFRSAMKAELHRAEERYRTGVAGIRLLPPDCRFPVLLTAVYYAEYHRLIRRRGYDVLSSPPELTPGRYLVLAVRTWWHWRRTADPEAAFYRVSAIPRNDERVRAEERGAVRGWSCSAYRSVCQRIDQARARWSPGGPE